MYVDEEFTLIHGGPKVLRKIDLLHCMPCGKLAGRAARGVTPTSSRGLNRDNK
jgi:hypothetical protein